MMRDPIVEEVRKAGEELFRQANYDMHTFFENLRKSEEKYKERLVRSIDRPAVPSNGPTNQQ